MKILVVEDDELVADVLTVVLSNQNYAVETAVDGDRAWELIETFNYDLILSDVMLPGVDGISLCRKIRSRGLGVPILLLTGCDNSHEKAVGLDAGADDYLVKPFDSEELLARVRALLRRGEVTSQPVLEWGELRLDPTSCEVSYRTEILSLTPKEYSLLELFLRNSRRVFSCGMILEHLWSYDDTPGEEAVRTHIKGLRHKLKTVGASGDLVETVYGIGYRLKPQQQSKNSELQIAHVSPTASCGQTTLRETAYASIKFKIQESEQAYANVVQNFKSEQQTLAALAHVWNKFKGRVKEQVNLLEQAAEASVGNVLNQELRSQAQREAHTLAGSLGTFGFPTGSNLARKIEHLVKIDRQLEKIEARDFCDLVVALRTEIELEPHKIQENPTPKDERPMLMIVDSDRTLAEQLTQESAEWNFQVAIAPDLNTARNKLYKEHPDVVLLDPSIFPSEDSFQLLAEFKARKPPVPVLVFTQETDLNNRLQVAKSGGQTFLQKPMPPAQVLENVTQVLHLSTQADAKILAVDDDPKILEVLQSLLSPWGLRVKTLEDPRRFWETLEDVQPDLLILDVEMPMSNGIELCQIVRNDSRWSELPILFLTAHTDADIINQVFSVGADDFVSKPIIGPELVTRTINRLERIKLLKRRYGNLRF
ncbi:MAG: response regulator [Cyanomargarita calcarea GSE-NOS-MK-12-04C]|jgi:DNA-binding response OmpR family regulator/HPt (histidine-containing phosphotransfer) domain-containing protein|uniref:Response regulator n=1 Tax=Cyanomargarita calcarea GSE-NOS-MK-12-04C TaxID=2839659 RepID=A0A951QJC2_9CYAN|nr:response regulator [Cyanomargarita calcarea GSE-NOS-MK-12-04C]